MTALCNQPEAFASDLGDGQSCYLFTNEVMIEASHVLTAGQRLMPWLSVLSDKVDGKQ